MALIRTAISSCTLQSQQRLTSSRVLVGASVLTSEGQISQGSSFEEGAGIAGELAAEDCAIYRAICDGCQLPLKAMAIHVKHFLQPLRSEPTAPHSPGKQTTAQSDREDLLYVNQMGLVSQVHNSHSSRPVSPSIAMIEYSLKRQLMNGQTQDVVQITQGNSAEIKVSPRLKNSIV